MVKTIGIAAVLCTIAAALLYQFAGVRVALDGSGRWPRFVTRLPDYDALEADRANQRERLPAAAAEASTAPTTAATSAPAEAPSAAAHPVSSAPAPGAASDSGEGTASRGLWSDFRGPNRDGRYVETDIRTDWPSEGLPQLWKQPIGLGYASFVVANGRAFTIEQRRQQEVVAAYDVETGRELWANGWAGEFRESMGGDGPRATPTYHDGRIYALGALGELRRLNARTGEVEWRRNILADNDAANLSWGMSAAPLIVDELVVVLPGGSRGQSVAAYHKDTGERVWTALDDMQAYTSPMLVTLAGVRQILVVSATRAMGLAPRDGRLLWNYPWATQIGINVAQPLLLGDDRVFLSAGYGHGAAVFEVSRSGDRLAARLIWENLRMKNKFSSSVLHEGHIYGLDESILACVEATTGELKWKAGRYGYGQVLLAGDHLIVLTEDGDLVLVRATPERHDELASFSAIEGKTWNHPVITDGRLLVRNLREMAAFDIRPREGSSR
jgi:outer membrane protein assembly factor BamB